MFSYELDGEEFEKFVSSILRMVKTCKVTFEKEWINAGSVDPAGVGIVQSMFKPDYADIKEDVTLIVDFEKLGKITYDDSVTLYINDSGELKLKSGRGAYKVPVLVTHQNRDPPNLNCAFVVQMNMDAKVLVEGVDAVVKTFDKLDSSNALVFNYDYPKLYLTDKEIGDVRVTFEGDDFTAKDKFDGIDVSSEFAHDYIVPVVKEMKAFGRVDIKMGDNIPIAFHGVNEYRVLYYAVAPRVRDE